ncbi:MULTISPECIES: YhfX family PLP-dependent enzyme [unclassified Virgibacillus]|uniref:YhfX family PLP-dependent enzyme n=1 Tax=unclassified Virgibacillus TaxID=2620237 RepID=UPI0024DE459A|nr:YhfX family PLP-dependent enzyme [Virgibacillus sp. LDC-1]
MFLDVTKRRNPDLIKTGVTLHQTGEIPPNTYIIDVDILKENVKLLSKAADKHEMTLYFMSKQLGRLPEIARIIENNGIAKAVAVDFDEGKLLAENGIKIGNIGHLVQPGKHQWKEVLSWNPEVVTIFSYERAQQLSVTARQMGKVQDILLKVVDSEDKIYHGQEGGIPLHSLEQTIDNILQLTGVRIVGVTTFPNLQLNSLNLEMIPTENLSTLLRAKKILEKKGIEVTQVNGPSGTSCETIPFLSHKGVTHGEPGHGLTGTTPLHAYKDLPEKPAIVYVSEVSHTYDDKYQVIAGGFYGRSNMKGCFVGHDKETIMNRYTAAYELSPESIDYYGMIAKPNDFQIEIGDTAIFAFRTQLFVTRAHIALVEGIQSGNPNVIHLERKW